MTARRLLLSVVFALVSAAQADPPAAAANGATVTAAAPAPNLAERNRPCPENATATGSRIPRTVAGGCGDPAKDNPALRVYNREQIERSGALNTGDVLRTLDPSVNVSRP